MARVARIIITAAALAGSPSGAGCRRVAGGQADGAAIFAETCARCHGPAGAPDPGTVARLGVKDLTQPELQDRLSDAEIAAQVQHGSKNQQMPSFATVLSPEQVQAVVAHVRTLRRSR